MSVDTSTDSAILAALDFAPPCEARQIGPKQIRLGDGVQGRKCEQEATYSYDSPACHCGRMRIQALLCTEHAEAIMNSIAAGGAIRCASCQCPASVSVRPLAPGAH